MKKLLLSAGLLVSAFAMNAAIIPGSEEKPLEMYALGAYGTTGVYKFNPTDWANPTKISSTEIGAVGYTGSGAGGGGTFLSSERVVGVKYNYGCYAFDVTAEGNGSGAWSGSYSGIAYEAVYDMTYDEKNDIIYCWYKLNSFCSTLGIYDPATKTITRVGNEGNKAIFTLAIDNDGQLWGIGTYGLLYSINKETAVATDVTSYTGCGISLQEKFPASAAIDPATNTMYVIAKGGAYDLNASLYAVDLATHTSTLVSKMGYQTYYNCLWIAGSSASADVPAVVEDLTAQFNGEATVVTFTAPKQTAGGNELSGELTYTIKVDGEEASTGSVEAGETKTVEINAADGEHEIHVSVANAEGESKVAKTSVYSGYDQPTAVSDLKIAAEGEQLKLTWVAPTGKHNGLLDMAKITYTVSLGDEEVAAGLTDTEYTCAIDWNYADRTYKVTVVYGEEAAESSQVSIMAGLPYETPYELDLANIASLGAAGVTVFELDGANSGKWELATVDGSAVLQSYSNPVWQRHDYAYLPPISLKAGVDYTVSFKVAAYRTAYAESTAKMQVLIANEPTTDSEAYTVLENAEIVSVKDEYVWNEYSIPVTVEADGNYNIGFADIASAMYTAYYFLNVKDITVTAAPAAADLQIETVAVPTEKVDTDEKGTITVKVTNKGTEAVDAGAYEVVLCSGEETLESISGQAIAAGESADYSFEIAWQNQSQVEYIVKVVFDGDEDETNNATEPITIEFDHTTGVGEVAAADVVIASVGSSIVVKNAEGALVAIYAADGRQLVSAVAGAEYTTPALAQGVYVVSVNGVTKKIAVRAI